MGPANDYRIWLKFWELVGQGNLHPGPTVARLLGCSRSTVYRAMVRERQRMEGRWPPEIPNGFGYSAEQRRRVRLQAVMKRQGQVLDPEQAPFPTLSREVREYVIPDQLQDRYDENGDEAW